MSSELSNKTTPIDAMEAILRGGGELVYGVSCLKKRRSMRKDFSDFLGGYDYGTDEYLSRKITFLGKNYVVVGRSMKDHPDRIDTKQTSMMVPDRTFGSQQK